LNQPAKILYLKIPYNLASRATAERHLVKTYETNNFIKYITFFLILKAESPFSFIQNYKKQIDHLSFITQCERQTFKKRLAWLVSEGLATIENEGTDIRLVSWKQVSVLYYCNLDSFKLVQYKPDEQKNIHLQLFAADIEDNKKRQTYIIQQKLEKNPALTQVIKNIMHQHGADEKKLNDFTYLLNGMRKLYRRSFEAEPEIHAMLNNVRPDVNRGVKGMAKAWSCRSEQTVSYVKKKLAEAGIIRIYKGERIMSTVRCRNKQCEVIYNRKLKQTFLCLVDTLHIIPQPGMEAKAGQNAKKVQPVKTIAA